MDGVAAMSPGGEVRPKAEVLDAMVREYCEKHGLDPAVTSVMFNAAYEITDHVYAPNPGFPMPKVDPSEVPRES
jgi:8-oxo-dGTP pyrophosphatase MutT (NUDIX family)